MGAPEVVDFLIKDHGDVNPEQGFRKEFAEDRPYKSLLQRNDVTLEDLLKMFDWKQDDADWIKEYDKDENDVKELVRLRRRIDFAVCGWRELKEDFGRNDVSCIRDLRMPLVTSRTPLRAMKDEFNA